MSLDAKLFLPLVKKNPILILCVVAGLGLAVTIYARSGLGREQQMELDQKADEGKKYHANLANSIQLFDELQTLTEANLLVHERAIKPSDLATNLQYFYRIEAETGVKFVDLHQTDSGNSPSPTVKRGATIYTPVNYSMRVSGDFSQIIAFLKNLEHGAHFCRLNSMTASQPGGGMVVTLNVDLLGQP